MGESGYTLPCDYTYYTVAGVARECVTLSLKVPVTLTSFTRGSSHYSSSGDYEARSGRVSVM